VLGIDVQAELQIKTGSPTLGFQHPAANVPQFAKEPPVPLQRTAMHRQQARRSGQNFLPKLAPGQPNQEQNFQTSPNAHPTPSSHTSSPTTMSTRSPLAVQQGGNTPPNAAVLAQPQQQQQQFQAFPRSSQQQPNQAFYQPISPHGQRAPQQQRPAPTHYQSNASVQSSHSAGSRTGMNNPMNVVNAPHGGAGGQSASAYYPSPFQKHIDQLGKLTRLLFPAELCRPRLTP